MNLDNISIQLSLNIPTGGTGGICLEIKSLNQHLEPSGGLTISIDSSMLAQPNITGAMNTTPVFPHEVDMR